jgi:drug/metabolite transporter (DMT)-like permease
MPSPVRRAYAEAGAAAVLFGLVAPVGKRLGAGVPPLALSGLLYLGAGLLLAAGAALVPSREARLSRRDLPALAGLVLVGGVLAPVLLFAGLARTSGIAASLLLNLQAVFAALGASLFFHEHVGRRGAFAIALVVGGAALVAWNAEVGGGAGWGLALVAGACLGWAADDNLTRLVASKNAVSVAAVKALAAGSLGTSLALALRENLPSPGRLAGLLVAGALGVGASLVLAVRPVRTLGVARTGAIFATAPFVGAIAALPILGERPGPALAGAGALMAAGIALLLAEHHGHRHLHEPLEHDHLHEHDEHHAHAHDGAEGPAPHSHAHRHERLEHDHPHLPDLHHNHRH